MLAPCPLCPQAKDLSQFKDKETNTDLEVVEKVALLEWLANNYKKFGCALEFVTNKWVLAMAMNYHCLVEPIPLLC